MTGPLEGVRVLELTTMITGPLAGMLLADLGAAVIKVENPKDGDLPAGLVRRKSRRPTACATAGLGRAQRRDPGGTRL